jgi:ribosomal protein S8E
MYAQKRHTEKIQMKKRIRAQEEKNVKSAAPSEPSSATPLPNYLLDRSQATNAKALSSAIKDKRSEKAAKFSVPLPKVKGISEEEMFKVVNTGKKTHKKSWKRMITKPTFVGQDFTRRNPKFERFIRYVPSPSLPGLRMGVMLMQIYIVPWVSDTKRPMSQSVSLPYYTLNYVWLTSSKAPRARRHSPTPHPLREKESPKPIVHSTRRLDQGYRH